MERTCARAAALAASMALLAAVGGCGDRGDSTGTPHVAHAAPVTAPGNASALLAAPAPAPAAPAPAGAQQTHAAIDGNVHSLGASGGTSVLDPDVLISARVKAALATSPDVASSTQVDVSSRDGAVTLRGRVPDPQARERATAIARSIPNVKDVDNQLTLG